MAHQETPRPTAQSVHDGPLTRKLADLDAKIEEKTARWNEARAAAQTDPWSRVKSAVEPLTTYFDAVRFRKRDADATEERRLVGTLWNG
jgi:hypothetical protein